MNRNVLVSDFDGTITERDFFDLIRERYMPADAPDYLAAWRAAKLSHFDAMAHYFCPRANGCWQPRRAHGRHIA